MKGGQLRWLWLWTLLQVSTGLAESPRLLVLVPEVEPWGYEGSQSEPAGLLADFYQLLFARAGLTPQIELRPYARVQHDLASGQADLSVMFHSPRSEQVARSLGAVVPAPVLVLARPDSRAAGLADLAGGRVGLVRGSRYGAAFDDNGSFAHVPVTNAEQGLRMLLAGRLEAMVCTQQSLLFTLGRTGMTGESLRLVTRLPEARADLYLSRAVQDAPWELPLTRALREINDDGSLARLFAEHRYWPAEAVCFINGPCIKGATQAGTDHE